MNLKCGVAPDVGGGTMVECHDSHRSLLCLTKSRHLRDSPLGRKIKLLRRGLRQALGRSPKGRHPMSREQEDQERPCLHCMIVELIDDFFAGNPATAGSDKVDTDEADEVIDAIAKTVAEL